MAFAATDVDIPVQQGDDMTLELNSIGIAP